MRIPNGDRYWLTNARVPVSLLEEKVFSQRTTEGFCSVSLAIGDGKIDRIIPETIDDPSMPTLDLQNSILFPGFVDAHTHLDKGHIWPRSPNRDGTFETALTTVREDAMIWSAEDLYRRMDFGIRCSYAHGTTAIRTHLDSFGELAARSFGVLAELQRQWSDRMTLQGVSLVPLDYYQTPEGVALADRVAGFGGILGGVAYTHEDLEGQLENLFRLASERGLDLDFHADENGDADSTCLAAIARTAIKLNFPGRLTCGHCCSLAVQSPSGVAETLSLVKDAGIAIISLPMCNLYLQDRQSDRTPTWRGVTRVIELKAQGIPVIFASDNCRDPFYGFGDHDGLEVFTQAVRIAHLDTPYGSWCDSVTRTPADILGLPHLGRIGVGLEANLIIFKARCFSELLSRPWGDRLVLRCGQAIDTTLPDYRELDDLVLSSTIK
jgi:cytosine/creatinine deaminase